MPLDARQIEPLSTTLSRLFTLSDLEMLMLTATGDGLYEAWVPPGLTVRRTLFALLTELDRQGLASRVLAEMRARRPRSEELRALLAVACPEALVPLPHGEIGLAPQVGGVPMPGLPDDAFAPGLQKNVRPHLAKLDLAIWIDRLAAIRRRVCRIEIERRAAGTAFLVGPSAVLTNWHVVEKAEAAGVLPAAQCRFDYVMRADGTREAGRVVALAADPLACHAAYGPAEVTDHPDQPLPEPGQLDFALLRLAEPAGAERGWLALPAAAVALAADAPLLIVQHPDGAPMKLALDTQSVIGPNGNGTRMRYRTNTENGSSGSPVFTMDWDPALLHHYGDPTWGAARFNQGVPLDRIRAAIVAAGHGALLEG
ncbi:serine protease [Cereibacter sphaeroides]|uniref:trypsin-like serine peptidase n=1 Tax=Cereibacter sphaeroides TaxID=1063 RepID=UPI001F3968A9|nr:serine protease [Cereibacter sphaeroides]MCE6949833.1 serine protease [Cereibacter sphaeroides]